MKLSDEVRGQAIEVLDLAIEAGGIGSAAHELGVATLDTALERYVYGPAHALACIARQAVSTATGRIGLSYEDECLEAAALLRDGWSPGDPVVRLKGGES